MRFLITVLLGALQLHGAQVLFEGARVIVDTRKAPMEDAAFIVDNGRITKMGKRGEVQVKAGVTRVDLSGKTVMPALIDPHVHLGYQKDATYAAENFTHENVTDQLQRYAYAGVAAVMSLGTDITGVELAVRAEKNTATQLFTAGRGFSPPNAGPATPAMRGSSIGVTSEDEARQGVRDQLAKHVDIIKIWVDDRNGTVAKLSPALYRAIIDEAHKRGARVIAHVYYFADAKELVRAGIDGFAHLVRDREIDDETVATIAKRRVFIMPNMGLAETRTTAQAPAWLDDPLYKAVTPAAVIERVRAGYRDRTPAAVETAQKTYSIMERNLAKLNAAGALIGFGADSGAVPDYFHAFTTHRELELMVHAGMTPAQALTSVTVNAAAFLKMAGHGTLDAGNSADFLVLEANPLENVSNTRKINRVYLHGQELGRAALAQGWK